MNVETLQKTIYQAEGQKQEITNNIEDLNKQLLDLTNLTPIIEETQILLQQTAKETQEQLRYNIEDIVNTGLELCFPETYSFCVRFENRRGKTECDLFLKNENGTRIDPLDSNGGGLTDIISFSLRMACWAISATDNLIILDEPFKFLSNNLRPLAGELLQTLSKKLNLQIIMVTHDQEMKDISNKIFIVKKGKDNISYIEEKGE